MGKGKSRVPQKDSFFDIYINATTDYLFLQPGGGGTPHNWERLGLTNTEATDWFNYRTVWNTKYGIYKTNIEKGTRDKTATEEKTEAKDNFTDWVTDPDFNKLNRIGASPNVTDADRNVFHIKKRKDNRTISKARITANMFFNLQAQGGGDMKATCRTSTDATRASIATDAKEAEIVWKTGTTPPNSVSDCPNRTASTKAIFTFNVNANNAGQKIYAFARWIDTTDPSRASVWSDLVTVIIT